jgi:hypothetical protein
MMLADGRLFSLCAFEFMQEAAAAARAAAQAAIRQELQQQAAAAARRYVAARLIRRAWAAYKFSPARARRVTAALVLQCSVRSMHAQQMLKKLKQHKQVAFALQQATCTGSFDKLQQVAAFATQAGRSSSRKAAANMLLKCLRFESVKRHGR